MPIVEVPNFYITFDAWYRGLKPYTDHLFSSAGESAAQDSITFSRYFPNYLGQDGLRFQPGFLGVRRVHALSVIQIYTEIYKVRYQWSLSTYDLLSDPRDYPTDGSGSCKFREIETRDPDQYKFLKNVLDKLGNADFKTKLEGGFNVCSSCNAKSSRPYEWSRKNGNNIGEFALRIEEEISWSTRSRT